MLVVATLFTLVAGVALALAGLPRRHPLRWLHRATAAGLILLSLFEGAWLLAGAAAVVAAGGLLAAHLPDRDWGLAILFTHAAGGLFLLVIAGLVASMPAPAGTEVADPADAASPAPVLTSPPLACEEHLPGGTAAGRPQPARISRYASFGGRHPTRTAAGAGRGIGSRPTRVYSLKNWGTLLEAHQHPVIGCGRFRLQLSASNRKNLA